MVSATGSVTGSVTGSSAERWPGRYAAVAIVAAPILLLASTAGYLANGEGMNEGELAGTLQVWAMVAFAIATVVLTRRIAVVAPRAATVLLVVGLAGAAGGVAYGIDAVQAAVFHTGSLQESESAVVPFALQLPGICFPLGLVGIGVMLARTGTAPGWAARVLVLGAIAFPIARIPDIEPVAVVGDVLLVIGLVAIGAAALVGREELGPGGATARGAIPTAT